MKHVIRLTRLLIPLCFVFVLTLVQWWGWGLLLAGASLWLLATHRWKVFAIVLPLTLASIAYLTTDWYSLVFWLSMALCFRWCIKDYAGEHFSWSIVCLILMPIVWKFAPSWVMLPITALVLCLPLPQVSLKSWYIPRWALACTYGVLLMAVSYNALQIRWRPQRGLYLEHGVWANAREHLALDNLTNRGAYSYDNFARAFRLDRDSTLNHLEDYDCVWLVTPTKPFTADELAQLERWVRAGGRLFLVADHTDLYGHTRVLNTLANRFGNQFSYTATFDANNKQIFTDAFAQKVVIKTGNSVVGTQTFPILSAWLWQEPAYYGETNFFGPLSPSGNNVFSPQVLSGVSSVGNGFVFYLDDSTFFANFAVYQPYALESLARLNTYTTIGFILKWLPWLWLVLLLSLLCRPSRWWGGWGVLAIGLLPLGGSLEITYDKPVQLWSGDASFIFEDGCPYANLSTAYALSSLSTHTPCWVDDLDSSTPNVIWVDTLPPPNSQWRWIEPHDIHYVRSQTDSPFESLYKSLHAQHYVEGANIGGYQHLNPSGVWTDAVMNDWWFNQGISSHRQARIASWIAWLDRRHLPLPAITANQELFSKESYPCILYIKDKDPITLHLPKPIASKGEVYLGQGISGTLLMENGKLSIIGQKPESENIEAPTAWVLDYEK